VNPPGLLFLLPHLVTDGPSRQWSLLVPALVEHGHRASVLTLDDQGHFYDELRSQGLPIACAAMRRRSDLRRLRQALGVVCPVAPDEEGRTRQRDRFSLERMRDGYALTLLEACQDRKASPARPDAA
jgi:hypothetical protein